MLWQCASDMVAYTQQLVDFYCEVTGVDKQKLRKVPSPAFPESQATDQELETTGDLHGTASPILMRALWLSRLARPDISFIITRLASKVSRWINLTTANSYVVYPICTTLAM